MVSSSSNFEARPGDDALGSRGTRIRGSGDEGAVEGRGFGSSWMSLDSVKHEWRND